MTRRIPVTLGPVTLGPVTLGPVTLGPFALGLAVACFVGVLAWLGLRDFAVLWQPDADRTAVTSLAYPGQPVMRLQPGPGDEPAWLRFMMNRPDVPPQFTPRDRPDGTAVALTADVRSRAEAAGWRTVDGRPDGLAFQAVRGDTRFDFYAFDMDPVGLVTWVAVHPEPAWWVAVVAVAGGLAAGALGAILARRMWRSIGERSPRSRAVIRETGVVGVILVVPALFQSALPAEDLPSSLATPLAYARWPAALGALLLVGVVTALLIRRPVTEHNGQT